MPDQDPPTPGPESEVVPDAAAQAETELAGRHVLPDAYTSDRAFTEFPLSPEVLQAIAELGYKRPTKVQAMTLEPGLAGKDMVVRSKTGTGKTAAFCIPIIERIPAGTHATRAIVLAPTRELALQVSQECAALAKYKDLRVTAIYGGVAFGPQETALRDGAEIVVGTPGRILDHLRRGNLDLSGCLVGCLDEADEMLSMGFYEDVKKILDCTPKDRQIFLFSATVDDRVKALVRSYMHSPEDIMLSTDADKVEGITHILYQTTPEFHKARALLAILDIEQPKSALIFCNTREDTATVQAFLSRQGLDCELISGELPQNKREKVMAAVKRGEIQFLVATDVAARGIDISDLSHVINYALPEDPAIYLHRTGRTGRIGKTGIAISLAGGTDMHTRSVLERQYDIAFEVKPLPTTAEADRSRVDRQVKAIGRAIGTMAFEGYLGTVRAVRERPDADMLFAAALRGFFLWDRMRKAMAENEEENPSGEGGGDYDDRTRGDRTRESGPRRRRDGPDGPRSRRDGPDGPRRDGPRRDGPPRRDGGRDRSGPRDRDRDRDRSSPRPPIIGEDRYPAQTEAPVQAELAAQAPAPAPAEGDGEARKRRRRRRRKSGGPEGSEGSPGAEAQTGGDTGGDSED